MFVHLFQVVDENDKFLVKVNVSQFSPEELSVNLKDKHLIIEGRHEERDDAHGTIERHFIRKYRLPDDALLDGITSHLNEDGHLQVMVPKKAIEASRKIPISCSKENGHEEK